MKDLREKTFTKNVEDGSQEEDVKTYNPLKDEE